MNSATDQLPAGLRVRKLAGDPNDPNARYYADHQDGMPSVRPFGGVVFVDERARVVEDPPAAFTVPHDYVEREPWIEVENPSVVVRPAGPPNKPYAKTHTLPHAEALLLHMTDSVTLRYRVVHQPDKYDDETGEVAERAGDPTTHVDWFYVVEYEGQV